MPFSPNQLVSLQKLYSAVVYRHLQLSQYECTFNMCTILTEIHPPMRALFSDAEVWKPSYLPALHQKHLLFQNQRGGWFGEGVL